MRPTLDPRLKQLLTEMSRAKELVEEEDFAGARDSYARLRQRCQRLGLRSAHVAWRLAAVCDALGDFEAALSYAREATELDPLALPYQRSYDLVIDRIRQALGDERRATDDPTTPRLYELLSRAGEGDARSHLAMARFLRHGGDALAAMRLLDAVTIVAPAFRPAWVEKAQVARLLGRNDDAARAEIEAAALATDESAAFPASAIARG